METRHPVLDLFPSCAEVHRALTHPRYRGGWLEHWRIVEATGLTAPLTHSALRRLERAGLVVGRRTDRGVQWRAA